MAIRKHTRARPGAFRETTLRHVWLAALGAVSTAQRRALETLELAAGQAMQLREQAADLSRDARDVARGVAMTAEERVEPLLRRAMDAAEAGLAPLLRKASAKPAARKARKPAGKTAGKTAARRGSGARRQAVRRTAARGRG
jgi:hypothetical protein